MKISRPIFLLLFFFSSLLLFASPYDMIPAGDPVLEDLRYLALETGQPFLSFTPPLAPDEVAIFLNSFDISELAAPAREAYNRVKKRLAPEAKLSLTSDYFTLLFNITSTIEARTSFNTDVSWYPEYSKVPPLLSGQFRFGFADVLQIYMEPLVAANSEYYYDNDKPFNVNIPLGYFDYDPYMPFRAFIATGGPWWNFQLGRDRLFWGTGNTGSLSFSDNSDYFEFARLSVFSHYFKYSLMVNQMPLIVNNSLLKESLDNEDVLTKTTQRYFYLHRVDFNFYDKVTLGLMEGIMVGNSSVEVRYLNPLMIFHSLFAWNDYGKWDSDAPMSSMVGSFLSLEVNWDIIKSFSAYGQFVMNEFATPQEAKDQPNQPPNALGYLAGLQFAHSFDIWASIFFLEFIYTDPYLYTLSSPFASFIQMRRSSEIQYLFIGYPRDSITLAVGTRFFKNDILSISGDLSWLCRGEHTVEWDWERTPEAFNETTPSGTAEHKFIASVGAKWKVLSYITLNGSLSGIYSVNNNHKSGSNKFGGQAVFSINFLY